MQERQSGEDRQTPGLKNPFGSLVKWLMLWLPEALQQLTAFSEF